MQPVSELRAQKNTGKKGDCGGSLSQGREETSEFVQNTSSLLLLTGPLETGHLLSLFTERERVKPLLLLPRIKFAEAKL